MFQSSRTSKPDLAARYDDYQSTGSKTTGKASARWTPVTGVLVRGAAGTGFRAPSLTDLYSANTAGVSLNGVSDPLRCPTTSSSTDCKTQFPVTLGGNRNLKPEESRNYTFGFVLEPVNSFSFGMDYWRIHIKNTILIAGISVPTILGDLGRYGSLVTRAPSSGGLPGQITDIQQTNVNVGATDVTGYDLDAKWKIPYTDYGRFVLGFTGTYFAKYDITLPDGSVDHAAGGFSTNIPGPISRWKQYLSLNWQIGAFSTTAAQRYQSAYQDVDGNAGAGPGDPGYSPHVVPHYQTYDLQSTWSGYKGVQLTLGVRNIFDTRPPYSNVDSAGTGQFQAGYDISYVDVHDRFIYARVGYEFK